MAFDRFTWVSMKRTLSDDERAQQLTTKKSVSDNPTDSFTIYEMNDTFLETCDSESSQIGWGLFGFLVMGPLLFYMTWDAITGIFDTPQAVIDAGSQNTDRIMMLCFSAILLLFCIFPLWMLLKDCFNYRRRPVRFNRKTRTVYAFRHNGPGGVVAIPWDDAFFYLQRQRGNGVLRTTPLNIRCLVLDANRKVVNTFSCGKRTVSVYGKGSSQDELVLDTVKSNFEYNRRYMEDGPAALPLVMTRLPADVSFSNSLRVWFHSARTASAGGQPFMVGLVSVLVFPLFIMAILHYIAQLTSREPIWPVDVETNSTAQDAATIPSR